jgi:hypothetical protein
MLTTFGPWISKERLRCCLNFPLAKQKHIIFANFGLGRDSNTLPLYVDRFSNKNTRKSRRGVAAPTVRLPLYDVIYCIL